jgi:trans-aconitate 2-methyltransferase
MAWNPNVYNQFKKERYAPFDDLLNLVTVKSGLSVVDLGCGTGELTRRLTDHLPASNVLGIDASGEMLQEAAAFSNHQLAFENSRIEAIITSGKKWDLVFSNAAIQWIDNHETLLPSIISLVNTGGQLAIQLPSNHDHITHRLLDTVALTEPYTSALQGWTRTVSTLSIEAYAQILFNHGGSEITVFEKVYPHVLENATALYNWMSGTALIRYLERLPADLQNGFAAAYKKQLEVIFSGSPVFYPFKRILMAAGFAQ